MEKLFNKKLMDKFFEEYHGFPSGILEKGKKHISKIIRQEIEKEQFDDESWLEALSDADGNKTKAKGRYIKIRFDQLYKIFKENVDNKEKYQKNQLKLQEEEGRRQIQSEEDRKDREYREKYREKLAKEVDEKHPQLKMTKREFEKLSESEKKKYREARKILLAEEFGFFGFNYLLKKKLLKKLKKKVKD